MNCYQNYFWREKLPYGIAPLKNAPSYEGTYYQIIADPYKKRISIEEYDKKSFQRVIYDSALFDFRHLNPTDQTAWEKTPLDTSTSLIRDQNGRAVLLETYYFEGTQCRSCQIHSIHGYPLCLQKIFYTSLGDPFNGVVLLDENQHPIMYKRYTIDENSGDFAQLLEENWNMQHPTLLSNVGMNKAIVLKRRHLSTFIKPGNMDIFS